MCDGFGLEFEVAEAVDCFLLLPVDYVEVFFGHFDARMSHQGGGMRWCDLVRLTYGNIDYSARLLRFNQKKTEGRSAHSGRLRGGIFRSF